MYLSTRCYGQGRCLVHCSTHNILKYVWNNAWLMLQSGKGKGSNLLGEFSPFWLWYWWLLFLIRYHIEAVLSPENSISLLLQGYQHRQPRRKKDCSLEGAMLLYNIQIWVHVVIYILLPLSCSVAYKQLRCYPHTQGNRMTSVWVLKGRRQRTTVRIHSLPSTYNAELQYMASLIIWASLNFEFFILLQLVDFQLILG